MKNLKFYSALALAALMTACSKEGDDVLTPQAPTTGDMVTYTMSVDTNKPEPQSSNSRVSMEEVDGKTKYSFDVNDALTMTFSDGGQSPFTVESVEDGIATITGEIPVEGDNNATLTYGEFNAAQTEDMSISAEDRKAALVDEKMEIVATGLVIDPTAPVTATMEHQNAIFELQVCNDSYVTDLTVESVSIVGHGTEVTVAVANAMALTDDAQYIYASVGADDLSLNATIKVAFSNGGTAEWNKVSEAYFITGGTLQPLNCNVTDANYVAPVPSSLTLTANGVDFDVIRVASGTFNMGSEDGDSDEKPVRSVTLSDYYIGETEVTEGLWEAVMGSNPSSSEKGDNYPVENVSWNDCQTFIGKLNDTYSSELPAGYKFAMPTEAQWEFAAKGGVESEGYDYSGSDTIDDVAWYSSSSKHQVSTKQANELGIYDMTGNVWEWCQDLYGAYPSTSETDPVGPSSGSCRVVRGGSWRSSSASSCGVSYRSNSNPSYDDDYRGVRLALVQE